MSYVIPGKPPVTIQLQDLGWVVKHSKWLELWYETECEAEASASIYAKIERVPIERLPAAKTYF